MNRVYLVRNAQGEQTFNDADLPLSVGGADVASLVLPDYPAQQVAAHLALFDGHVFLQPADGAADLFHNHERLQQSVWLKSGDLVEANQSQLRWNVRGDQVIIEIGQRPPPDNVTLEPPANHTQASLPDSRVLPAATAGNSSGAGWLRYTVFSLLGLILLIALFVLLATPVRVTVEPQPEDFALQGFPPPLPLWGRYLALPGEYELRAKREGFYPLQEQLAVERAGVGDFQFQLRPLPGMLSIETDPAVRFQLFVDDQPVQANAQGVFELEQGLRQLRLETERYLPATQELEVAGFGKAQQLELTLQPAWADVSISSEPAGAEVSVDGQPLGQTPLAAEILQGERNLQLALAGYKTFSVQQQVNPGETLNLPTFTLIPADGQLVLETRPQGATVSVNGQFYGRTPLTVSLPSGEPLQVSLLKDGYVPVKETLSLQPEQEQTLEVELRSEMGTIFLSADPADAKLFINGKPAGLANRRLRLSTRSHTLEIRKPGFTSQRITVTPRAGSSQAVDITLVKAGQPAGAGTSANTASNTGGPSRSGRHTTADGYQLLRVEPQGSFMMGASRREPGRRANESRRKVELTKAFYLGDKEVTNAQFRRFRASHRSAAVDGAGLDTAQQPVINVSWDDAARYCNWLSKQEGLQPVYEEHEGGMRLKRPVGNGYRLPSEAEWAYVARIHQRAAPARYAWAGSYPPTTVNGNYADAQIADTLAEVVPGGYDDGYRGTAPVGSFPPSPPGFYDLGGNVAEWVNDYYVVYPAAEQTLVRDPLGPLTGQHRVVRGSSWRHGNITELRLSYRDYSKRPRTDVGFRIARYAQ